MQLEVKVPTMGESISEATIGTILKPTGSFVKADDELIELETDKVNQVLYAQNSGVITWKINKDDVVKIGQVLGLIDTEKKGEQTTNGAQEKSASTAAAQPAPQPTTKAAPPPTPQKTAAGASSRTSKEQFISELSATPPPLYTTSPQRQSFEVPVSAPVGSRTETRKPMSRIRKAIATRLVDVLQKTAMLTTFNEVDMTNIMSLRETYKEAFVKQYNVRLGFMPFFVKAAVSAMKAFPEINSYIDGDDIVHREYFDIGIAVGTDKGLFVPVVRECDTLSFADIERSIESYAKKSREGGLSPGDLQGGGFTITNGGTYGSLLSTPILNPPQSAILGMHKISKRAVVVNDTIVIRQMMYLALSYDHRVVDGKEAVSFLVHIKNTLEDPSRLILGL